MFSKRNFFILIFNLSVLGVSQNILATPVNSATLWEEVVNDSSHTSNQAVSAKTSLAELKYRRYFLDESQLSNQILDFETTSARADGGKKAEPFTLTIPLPDGRQIAFEARKSSVLSTDLVSQFPNLKTWRIENRTLNISGRAEMTEHGFHAMLILPNGDTVFVEPDRVTYQERAEKNYLSFSKKENRESFRTEFKCGVHKGMRSFRTLPTLSSKILQSRAAEDLITYRLAVAATGEYTNFHGGTKSAGLAAITTTINRVNEIYERDLGITFELVPQQLDIIYTDANTDPYTNSNVVSLLNENKTNLSNAGDLDSNFYDIGHVFGAGNTGGLANVGAACGLEKAGGVTAISNPLGDTFALDYVAHELAHQLGGTHTFNSLCGGGSERTQETAVEPGSGSTILSYAGVCAPNNIQQGVDAQFHAVSIEQIMSYSRAQGGSSCGVRTSVNNENPIADAGDNSTVPARTPLMLVANGFDMDGDSLTYSWEQADTGTATDMNVDAGNNAIFKSQALSTSNIRYIPPLPNLFSGIPANGEVLPVTNRDIEMKMTVRDGKGGVQTDTMNMNVFDTGTPFQITSHSSEQTFNRGDVTSLNWDVAGTNASPIACEIVDVNFITESGELFHILTTSNDGQQNITIPELAQELNNARFMVACTTSQFFTISPAALRILLTTGSGNSGSSGGGSISTVWLIVLCWLGIYSKSLTRRKRKSQYV